MPAAARKTDKTKHDSPHCHAPIHPPAPTPTPLAHPSLMPIINAPCSANVMAENLPAAMIGDQTLPCSLPGCVPAGPGLISKGSMSVMVNGKPFARADDIVAYASCVAPIPSPTGKIMGPCATKVQVGG